MTKQEELKLLEQIESLILTAPADSYIAMTFAGMGKVCRDNIVDDFGNCPVKDLEEMRKRYNAMELDVIGMNATLSTKDTEIKALRADSEGMEKRIEELQKQVKKVEDERDAMCDSADGLGEIIDEMEKETAMFKAELKQYIRGDIVAEVRIDERHRVLIERGIYGEFLVGTQEHITADSSCKWEYMQNGWRWHELEYRNSEEDARETFATLVNNYSM